MESSLQKSNFVRESHALYVQFIISLNNRSETLKNLKCKCREIICVFMFFSRISHTQNYYQIKQYFRTQEIVHSIMTNCLI